MTGISVIIPALNEALLIEQAINKASKLGDCEIIVVDGGSTDGTEEIAAKSARVIRAPRGRASQQNAGARVASGEILLFLHADCWLEPGSVEQIRDAVADSRCVAGCFRQRIDSLRWAFRWVERGNAWRVRLLGWAYGDQAIFVRRSAFENVGGFPSTPLLEDLYLMKAVRQLGKIRLCDGPVHVDPRRWERRGIIRQTLHNWSIILRAACGVSPEKLAAEYQAIR